MEVNMGLCFYENNSVLNFFYSKQYDLTNILFIHFLYLCDYKSILVEKQMCLLNVLIYNYRSRYVITFYV